MFKKVFKFTIPILLFLFIGVGYSYAANGVTTDIDLLDTDLDGDIETIDLKIDNDDLHTWSVNGTPFGNTLSLIIDADGTGAGNAGTQVSAISSIAIQGSATADPVTVRITLDENDLAFIPTTNGIAAADINFEVVYSQGTGDQTCTNCIKDGTDNELNAIAEGDSGVTDTETDEALPQISGIYYNDNLDSDGKIDQFIFGFSEELAATSVISASNFTFANVGDFTDAVFGGDTTDLATDPDLLQITVDLGTEATVVDTNDGSGALSVNLVGTFNLDDENGNSNTAAVSPLSLTPQDQAYAIPTQGSYTDTNNDGTIDRIAIQFSEPVTFTYNTADWAFSTAGDVGLSGDFDPGDCAGSGTNTMTCTDADNSALSATANRTGLQSGAGVEPVWAYTSAFSLRLYGTADFFDVLNFNLTLSDAAQPILVSHTPADGATGQLTTVEPVLTFSEQIDTGTFAATTTNDPTGGYTETWSSGNTVLTLEHANGYSNSDTISIDVTTATASNGVNTTFAGAGSSASDPFEFTITAGGGGTSFGAGEGYNVTGTLKINNGAEETDSGDVTLQISATASTAQMVIDNDPGFAGKSWQSMSSQVSWTLEEGLGEKTVYIRFRDQGHLSPIYSAKITRVASTQGGGGNSASDNNSTDDSVDAQDESEQDSSETQDSEQQSQDSEAENAFEELSLPEVMSVGDLVKSESNSSIYYIGSDKKRHGFINERVFYSYYKDFSSVKVVNESDLAQVPLGKNVKLRAGSWLVKIVSDPKVYAVEPGGVLRWITSEELAESLYGKDWNKNVIDIDVAYFVDYQIGEPVNEAIHPNGTLVNYSDGAAIYYVESGKTWQVEELPLANPHIYRATSEQAYSQQGSVSFKTIMDYSMAI